MNKPLNSPTTRSRSPTLSSSPPYFPSDPNSNSISTFQKQPPLYTFENSDAYLNDTSSAHPTLPLPQPQVVTIPSPFSSTVTSPHQDLHVPFDMSSPSGLTRVNLSRPLLNGHGRPYPTSFFLVASILLLCFSTSNGTTSVFLQSLLCMVTPFLFIFLKQLWVPNPKDDDVLVPSSIPSYIRKFGFISCLWYGICLFSFTTINAVPGPIALSCTQAILPILVLALSKRLIRNDIKWDQLLLLTVLGLVLGVLLVSGALLYTEFHWSVLLSFITVFLQALNLVWLEKYMTEVETDPWVFCRQITPAATLLALVGWVVFDRTFFDTYGVLLRNAVLYGMQWMAITFLLNHVSAFTVAMGMGVRDLVFLMVYWQLQGLHLRWFGYIGFICVGVSAYFCTQLLKKIQEQQHRYTALQNPI